MNFPNKCCFFCPKIVFLGNHIFTILNLGMAQWPSKVQPPLLSSCTTAQAPSMKPCWRHTWLQPSSHTQPHFPPMSDCGSLRGQTPGASEVNLLKKKKEGPSSDSGSLRGRTRSLLFLLQEFDLGGSRSLTSGSLRDQTRSLPVSKQNHMVPKPNSHHHKICFIFLWQ